MRKINGNKREKNDEGVSATLDHMIRECLRRWCWRRDLNEGGESALDTSRGRAL